MASAPLLGKPEISFDFNLPHGVGLEEASHRFLQNPCAPTDNTDLSSSFCQTSSHKNDVNNHYEHAGPTLSEQVEHVFDYRPFSPGFSDDEGSGEAFERSWLSHQARKQAAKAAKGKSSARRSNSEGSEANFRAKKLRRSLFGGANGKMDIDAPVNSLFAPATPGHSLGNGMSGLALDQQEDEHQVTERPTNAGFDLASSDIGSVCASPAPSDDEPIMSPDTAPYYELRQNINRQKAVTHVDSDKSGNFDPKQEAKERTAKLLRAKAAKKEKKEKRKKKVHAPKDYAMKCIAKLPIDAFGNVRNITNDEQNWPDNWSEIDSEQERELQEYRAAIRVKTPDREMILPQLLSDPAGEVDDLVGHPAARGCKQCRKLKQTCSMVTDGRYPCRECTEDGSGCQPIQQPAVKGRCKQCHQAKAICSFEKDQTQSICNYCAENDHICEAAPPDGYKAPRINIEEIIWGPGRSYIACTACRKAKRRCTLKRKEDNPPCQYCKTNNLGCTFYHLPTPTSASGKQMMSKKTLAKRIMPEVVGPSSEYLTAEDLKDMDRRSSELSDREPTPEVEMEDGEGNMGTLAKITTSFAHPIRFSTRAATDSDCNFCDIPVFGIVGYFERVVDVIRWHNGRGFAEIGGGHCQDAGGRTTMCSNCTNNRLQIVVCPGHQLERVADTAVDHEALADELAEAATDIQYQLQRWCSLCFSAAVYGCSTVQPDVTGQEEAMITGCNLRLCAACEQALREQHAGDFGQMISDMEKKPKISEADEILGKETKGMPRADIGFLHCDGLLMQTVLTTDD